MKQLAKLKTDIKILEAEKRTLKQMDDEVEEAPVLDDKTIRPALDDRDMSRVLAGTGKNEAWETSRVYKYYTYEQMNAKVRELAQKYPRYARVRACDVI